MTASSIKLESIESDFTSDIANQTFVILRPNFNRLPNHRRTFTDTVISHRKSHSFIRHDPQKGHAFFIDRKTIAKSKSYSLTPVIREKEFYIPSLSSRGRDKGYDGRTVYEKFNGMNFDYAVIIGVEPGRFHDGFSTSCKYELLFMFLNRFGYDPLAILHDKQIRDRLEHQLASVIYSASNSRSRSGINNSTVKSKVLAWAKGIRDYVRDYIIGSIAPVPKEHPSESTIQTRISRSKKNNSLYKYGVMNALYEVGTLCNDIDVIDVIPIIHPIDKTLVKKRNRKIKVDNKATEEIVEEDSREIQEFETIFGKSFAEQKRYALRINKEVNDFLKLNPVLPRSEYRSKEEYISAVFNMLRKKNIMLFNAFTIARSIRESLSGQWEHI